MNAPGIVLVHGYTGRPGTLTPMARLLAEQHGESAVRHVHLPGHTQGAVPSFDALRFGEAVDAAVDSFGKEMRPIILLGHSTGGTLVLDHIRRKGTVPSLLILAGTPAAIQGCDLTRWETHRSNRSHISLLDVARMVSWVNGVGATPITATFPVLVIQGGADPLVPPSHARRWCRDVFGGPVRRIVFPHAGHDLFAGPDSGPVLDFVCRAVGDATAQPGSDDPPAVEALAAMDRELAVFLRTRPQSASHLVRSPAASRALSRPIRLDPMADTEPIQLNVEITSRCNLACRHCARSLGTRPGKDMDRETFQYLLDLTPHTYKLVLVGLGEPTLHPQLADFVALASQKGRRVDLVTNAMALEKPLSRQLLAAGLGGMTFSLDSVDPAVVSRVRSGSDVDLILGNIREFAALAGNRIPTAVFTAVSLRTVSSLPGLAKTVAGLGVKAWMLSDLNFQWNRPNALWRNWTGDHREAVAEAVKLAFSHAVPVLSVRGIEELGLGSRYGDFLMTTPTALQQRSKFHRWCLSPWQTLPVDVEGNAMVCDCRPHARLGNLLTEPFTGIWNGALMQRQRRLMRSEAPPAECRGCPRF